jgi:hypothetical protein
VLCARSRRAQPAYFMKDAGYDPLTDLQADIEPE